jgi:sugar/nucleoside kinase (ribokinase family)
VVVTSGRDGASWVDGRGAVTLPAESADCVDSTGAGDAFDAGVLSAWLHGKSTMDALRAGIRLGTRAIGRVGAQP